MAAGYLVHATFWGWLLLVGTLNALLVWPQIERWAKEWYG